MKQEIVGEIVAKLAKEKGFDEWCDDYYQKAKQDNYNHYGTSLEYKKGECVKVSGNHKNSITTSYNQEKIGDYDAYWEDYSAPTQSFLCDWLRVKYNIEVRVAINSLTCYFPMISIIDVDGTQMKGPAYKNYKSYEKAMESGLYEALNLIKT